MAKQQIRFLAPGHKRPEMVAHGVGHWWIGPGLNDFDPHLIQACQNRKRKFQQSDTLADAKTFINNMIRNGDWANFALRCDEALALRQRDTRLSVAAAEGVPTATKPQSFRALFCGKARVCPGARAVQAGAGADGAGKGDRAAVWAGGC